MSPLVRFSKPRGAGEREREHPSRSGLKVQQVGRSCTWLAVSSSCSVVGKREIQRSSVELEACVWRLSCPRVP